MKSMYEDSAKKSVLLAVICAVVAVIFFNVSKSLQSDWTYYFDEDAQNRYKLCNVLGKIMVFVAATGAVSAAYYFYKSKEVQFTVNLMACPDCGRMLSKNAQICPRCGRAVDNPQTAAEIGKGSSGSSAGVNRAQDGNAQTDNMIICPVCGAPQRKDRTCCYRCATSFGKDSE